MSHRNLTYLNNNRIVYRKYSSDDPTDSFDWGWYYADGTYGYYSLFNTKAKINSYKSLKWHLLTLWYLNPKLTMDEFRNLSEYICYENNGFMLLSPMALIVVGIIIWVQRARSKHLIEE